MLLKDYLRKYGIHVSEFARTLSVSREHLRSIIAGTNYPSRRLAIAIRNKTDGEVSKMELMFPEDF